MLKHNFVLIGVLLFLSSVYSQDITGRIVHQDFKTPLHGANIILEELKLGTTSNAQGNFIFFNVPDGAYHLRISYIGHKTEILKIIVPLKKSLEILLIESNISLNEIMITGNPLTQDLRNISQSVTQISGFDFKTKRSLSIANTLESQAGINNAANGISASKPVIRGFNNNRILVLLDGFRMGDLSNTAFDHSISEDIESTEKIEIIRGPASLLYGNNAIGGIINIITYGIPEIRLNNLISDFNYSFASGNNQKSITGKLNYGIKDFSFSGSFSLKKSGNYKTNNSKYIDNSDLHNSDYRFGIAYLPENWIIGISFNKYQSDYGIPTADEVHHHDDNEEEEENHSGHSHSNVLIAMEKQDFRAKIHRENLSFLFFKNLKINYGYQDYAHDEKDRRENLIESGFKLQSHNIDLSLAHNPLFYNNNGIIGFNYLNQNYSVNGAEALTPNSKYTNLGLYFYETYLYKQFHFNFGLRYDFTNVHIPNTVLNEKPFLAEDKKYDNFSISLGTIYHISDYISFFGNLANAYRAPTVEELSSYSVHEATNSFDIGNMNLKSEKNLGFEVGFRLAKEHHSVETALYYNRISNYIFKENTGEFYNEGAEEIPIHKYLQTDAAIYGFEIKALYEFSSKISTTIIADYVTGKNLSTDNYLSQMPPFRFSIEQKYYTDNFWAGIIQKFTASQTKLGINETQTSGYGLTDLYMGSRFILLGLIHNINVKIENLWDKFYSNHLSSIKDTVPMPGRNIIFSYSVIF